MVNAPDIIFDEEKPETPEFMVSLCAACKKVLNPDEVSAFLDKNGLSKDQLFALGGKEFRGQKILISHGCCRACFLQNYPGNEDIAPKE